MTKKVETLIACVAVGWACGTLLRDLLKGTAPAETSRKTKTKVKTRKARPRALPQTPISVDEFHTTRWEIEHETDIVGRIQEEDPP